jgi:hypothetical protein
MDHPVEHLQAQFEQDLVGDIGKQVSRRVLRAAPHNREAYHCARHDPLGAGAAFRAKAVIEQRLEKHGNSGLARGDETHGDKAERNNPDQGTDVRPEPAHHGGRRRGLPAADRFAQGWLLTQKVSLVVYPCVGRRAEQD